MEKQPVYHAGAWLSLYTNRTALGCEQFYKDFLKNFFFFAGDKALPTEHMSNEELVESVRYHSDGYKSSEVNLIYAFPVFTVK